MLDQRILFVDGEALVIDKPAGLPVDAPKRGGDCIAARLDELRLGFARPPTVMHRLDRDTSGCLLLARNPRSRAQFQQAFEAGAVGKYYLAVVEGEIAGEQGEIDLPLIKWSSAEQGWRMIPDESDGPGTRRAVSRWRRCASRDGRSLVEFQPLTGRTHQVRAHAAYGLGAAVVGDPIYGSGGEAMMLHAARLVVPRTARPPIDVEAQLPDHFAGWSR